MEWGGEGLKKPHVMSARRRRGGLKRGELRFEIELASQNDEHNEKT